MQALDADFVAFSGHKLMAPMGIGVLYGKEKLLDAMPPFLTGGEMIDSVTRDGAVYAELPHKFEAGTVNAGGAVALAAAIDYLESIGLENVHAQEQALTRYAYEGMKKIPGVNILGSDDPDKHCGILSFTVDGVHPHDIATILDSCHVLYEYAVFIAKIKRYRDSIELKEAIDLAVRKCIEEDILRDFFGTASQGGV